MKHSEIIRKAMKTLAVTPKQQFGNQSPYVCDNLSRIKNIYHSNSDVANKVDEIKDLIRERINNLFSLDRWLIVTHDVDRSEIIKYDEKENDEYFTKEFQKYRLAWMKSLAQEYEAKGM